MAHTFLIASPAKAANGKLFRVVKDRAWDDMPWSYLVQVRSINYRQGRDVASWCYTHKFATREEALAVFNKKVGH